MDDENRISYANQVLLAAEINSITSEDVQNILGNSMTASRMILRKLWTKGLLGRKKLLQPSGGIYYRYTLAKSGHARVDWLHSIGY